MMKKYFFFLSIIGLVFFLLSGCSVPQPVNSVNDQNQFKNGEYQAAATANFPFPQSLSFTGCIKPSNVTQAQLNEAVAKLYTNWKNAYLRPAPVTPGGYVVFMHGTGGVPSDITTSEAMGYGMIITALMGGWDPQAQTYFDGLVKVMKAHPSSLTPDLMAWAIHENETPAATGDDSATDGDLDMAYALILADKQWGSSGAINYLAEAQRIITNGIKVGEIDNTTGKVRMGDWELAPTNTLDPNSSRPSDWMVDHFRAFKSVTGDAFWDKPISYVFTSIASITSKYSATTGLMPDFVYSNPPQPAPANFLEGPNDGAYDYNACRYPWRIATEYAHYGTAEAKTAAQKVAAWIRSATSNNPDKIMAGYKLAGGANADYIDPCFMTPLTAVQMVDTAGQTYLNAGWTRISEIQTEYYGDSVGLLSILLLTGNWWNPITATPKAATNIPAQIVLPTSGSPNTTTYDFSSSVARSATIPGGLTKTNVPQFVIMGYDDNQYSDGMSWVLNLYKDKKNPAGSGNPKTFDGQPCHVSFYFSPVSYIEADASNKAVFYEIDIQTQMQWKLAYYYGHETGNHTYTHNLGLGDVHTVPTNQAGWETEMQKCNTFLTSIGIPAGDITGFRAPFLETNASSFAAMKAKKIWYDCSTQEAVDGNFDTAPWPYTNAGGVWEIPCYAIQANLSGLDWNIFYQAGYQMNKDQALTLLKSALDKRLAGNRLPYAFGLHSNEYSQLADIEDPAPNTKAVDRRYATENFVNYALTKSDVRFVSGRELITWMRNPVGLNNLSSPTPTKTPTSTPTASSTGSVQPTSTYTATATATPTVAPSQGEYPVWDPNNYPYKKGDIVIYNGKNWICDYAHSSNSAWYPGAPGLWIWKELTVVPTPSATKSPATPTKTPTATYTPVVTPSKTPTPTNTVVVTPTKTPTPTNTPVFTPTKTPTVGPTQTTCKYPLWDKTKVYSGASVHWNGHDWQSKWWTQGEEPGTTGEWGVWKDLGVCTGQ